MPLSCQNRFSLPTFALLLGAAVLALGASDCDDEASPQGGWTIHPEAPGASCALGGIRIEGGEVPLYVCNGAEGSPGASPQVTEEPPGEHCASGGLQVVSETGTFYLCDGASAPISAVGFCGGGLPADDLGGAGGGTVLSLAGITGGAVAPATSGRPEVTGAILPAGTCHEMQNPYDPATGQLTGNTSHSPYTLFAEIGRETPPLIQALLTNQVLSGATLYHDGVDALGEATTPAVVTLQDVRVAVVRLQSHPDPENPARHATFQRVDLTYSGIAWEWTGSGQTAEDPDVLHVTSPPGEAPCEPTEGSRIRQFVTVSLPEGDPLPGDATLPGEEGTIAAFGACHTLYLPLQGGMATGNRQTSPVTFWKREDPASAALREALFTNLLLPEVELRFYRTPTGGGEASRIFRIRLQDARVVGVSERVLHGVRYEGVTLLYDAVTWESLPDGTSVTDTWAPSPF